MAARKRPPAPVSNPFDLRDFLDSAGVSRTVVRFAAGARIFAQGSPATSVFYIQSGRVKISIVSAGGKEAVIAILGTRDFFGEGCRKLGFIEYNGGLRIKPALLSVVLHA